MDASFSSCFASCPATYNTFISYETVLINGTPTVVKSCTDDCQTIKDTSTGECVECPTGCKTCSASSLCETCSSEYTATYEGICLRECMDPSLLPQVLEVDFTTFECTNTTHYNSGVVNLNSNCWNPVSNASVDNL